MQRICSCPCLVFLFKYMSCWLGLTVWISVRFILCNDNTVKAAKELDLVLRTWNFPLKWPFKNISKYQPSYPTCMPHWVFMRLEAITSSLSGSGNEKHRVAVSWENTSVSCPHACFGPNDSASVLQLFQPSGGLFASSIGD